MLEKYFIFGGLGGLLALIFLIVLGFLTYWRFKHLKKLAQINILKRQQIYKESTFFSTLVVNKALAELFFSFSDKAKNALIYLIGGRPKKAALYFRTKNKPLSLLLQAFTQTPEKIYGKLKKSRKNLSCPQTLLATAQLAHFLFFDRELPSLLRHLSSKHLTQPLKAYKAYLLAISYLQEGDMLSASEQASLALKLFKHQHFLFEEAQTYLLLAEIYRISCVNDIAQTMIESALKIFSAVNLDFFKAQTTAMLGMLMLFENRLEEAEDKLNTALQTSNKRLSADIFNQLSLLHLAKKDEKSAQKNAHNALILHQQINNARGIAFSLQLIGHFALDNGKNQKATTAAKNAAALYLEQKNYSAYAESLYLQARALSKQKKYSAAEKLLRQILEQNKTQDLNFHIADAYSLLGLIFLQKNDLQRAKTLLQQSLFLEQNHERCNGLAADYANLALIEKLSGNQSAAADNIKLALEYAQKTEDADLINLIQKQTISA